MCCQSQIKPEGVKKMKTKNRTPLTPIEVCTLMAHETVSMLDVAAPEALEAAAEFRAALSVYSAQQDLGEDGEALLAWVDAEIDGAKQFAADGTDCLRVIDPDRLLRVPDAAAQMDAVRMLLQTAMRYVWGHCDQKKLLDAARMVAEMGGLDELILTARPPANALDSSALRRELEDVRAAFQEGPEPELGEGSELEEGSVTPAGPTI